MVEPPEGNPAPSQSPAGADETLHLLVIATEVVIGQPLLEEIRRRVADRSSTVRVVCPAVQKTRLRHAMGDPDPAISAASERLEASIGELNGAGVQASGEIGDSDPILSAEDALSTFPADEVLIIVHPDEQARWFEGDLLERAKQRLEPPITVIAVKPESSGHELADIKRTGPGTEEGGRPI